MKAKHWIYERPSIQDKAHPHYYHQPNVEIDNKRFGQWHHSTGSILQWSEKSGCQVYYKIGGLGSIDRVTYLNPHPNGTRGVGAGGTSHTLGAPSKDHVPHRRGFKRPYCSVPYARAWLMHTRNTNSSWDCRFLTPPTKCDDLTSDIITIKETEDRFTTTIGVAMVEPLPILTVMNP